MLGELKDLELSSEVQTLSSAVTMRLGLGQVPQTGGMMGLFQSLRQPLAI